MSGCTILIIDDDAEDVEFISDALKKVGDVQLQQVDTAKKAYQYLETTTTLPHLIICDLFLMDSMGATFLWELQRSEVYKNIKAVLISTASSDIARTLHPDLKAFFLQKPSTEEGYLKIAAYILNLIEDDKAMP